MRNKWFGDNRDLVKWSILLQLAKQYQADIILQVAYYRPNTFGTINIDGIERAVPQEVTGYFRNIINAQNIFSNPKVQVFDRLFDDRTSYIEAAKKEVQNLARSRCVVFLDPDTGLQPNKPNHSHVLNEEVYAIFSAMKSNDVFVCNQHQTNKNARPWIEPKRKQLVDALQLSDERVRVATGMSIARDVVFYYTIK